MGCANPEGATGFNIARQIALRAGCPVTTSGMTVNRYCSSGLQAVSMAAQRIIVDGADVMVAGGVESISLVQGTLNTNNFVEDWMHANLKSIYYPMLSTAEIVAQRYTVSRESQDEYSLISQQRTAAAQAAGKFKDEIVPFTTTMEVTDKASGQTSMQEVTLTRDEGNRGQWFRDPRDLQRAGIDRDERRRTGENHEPRTENGERRTRTTNDEIRRFIRMIVRFSSWRTTIRSSSTSPSCCASWASFFGSSR
jgi:hypothetical protein